jgi:hypothetical protein
MADVTEINCLTGEVIERDFTPEELAQREKDVADFAAAEAARIAEEKAKTAAKESALKKLAKLGLSEEEVSAILGV